MTRFAEYSSSLANDGPVSALNRRVEENPGDADSLGQFFEGQSNGPVDNGERMWAQPNLLVEERRDVTTFPQSGSVI